MKTVQERTEEVILEQISKGQAVDVYRLAKEILQEFPGQQLQQIAELVSAAVIRRHGNAFWDKQELERPDSESVRRTA
jgi:hypothetical protein